MESNNKKRMRGDEDDEDRDSNRMRFPESHLDPYEIRKLTPIEETHYVIPSGMARGGIHLYDFIRYQSSVGSKPVFRQVLAFVRKGSSTMVQFVVRRVHETDTTLPSGADELIVGKDEWFLLSPPRNTMPVRAYLVSDDDGPITSPLLDGEDIEYIIRKYTLWNGGAAPIVPKLISSSSSVVQPLTKDMDAAIVPYLGEEEEKPKPQAPRDPVRAKHVRELKEIIAKYESGTDSIETLASNMADYFESVV